MRRVRGFTLLEVVVAVAILGVSVGLAVQLFSQGLNNVRRIELAHQAMSHAENLMNEILSDESIDGPRQFAGDLDEDFTFRAAVDYWEPPSESRLPLPEVESRIQLLSVMVEVHYRDDPHGKLFRTATLKSVSNEPFEQPSNPADALRRLFGGPSQ
jgi:general secretion pathway protein I